MKLLRKINKAFIAASVGILLGGLVALYLILSVMFDQEIKESLSTSEIRIQQTLSKLNTEFNFPPFLEITKADTLLPWYYKDTLFPDPVDGEPEPFTGLHTFRNINGNIYQITVRTSSVENEDIAVSLFWGLGGLLLAFVLIIYLANRRITVQLWKPFYRNLRKIKEFSVSDDQPPVLESSSIQEFNQLFATIGGLMEKGINDYKNLKQFTENAAHELQTPLAVIDSKIENLINTGFPTEIQMKLFSDINREVRRLSSLNKSLLLLAKIENGQFDQKTSVDFGEILNQQIENLLEMAELKKLTLTRELSEYPVKEMNREMAGILVSNLLMNAIRHTAEGGKIHIISSKNSIEFSNSGLADIPESSRLFERFYKGEASSPSAGLGLAIVNSICTHFNIKIYYTFFEKMHRFRLQF